MKCPYCWAEKAYIRRAKTWKDALLYCLLLRPMKCNHCYHKFVASWFSTFGKQTKMPLSRANTNVEPGGMSYAAQRHKAELANVSSRSRSRVLS